MKCTFVIGFSLMALPIVNAYNQSKALDQVQHNVQNIEEDYFKDFLDLLSKNFGEKSFSINYGLITFGEC